MRELILTCVTGKFCRVEPTPVKTHQIAVLHELSGNGPTLKSPQTIELFACDEFPENCFRMVDLYDRISLYSNESRSHPLCPPS